MFKNPLWSNDTYNNDIALMLLSGPVTLTNYIQTACLPSQSSEFPAANNTGVVVGWGSTSFGGALPDTLNNVRVDIYSNASCVNFGYDPQGYSYNYTSQVCAGIYLISHFF